MIILRVILFLIFLLFSVVILGILKLFASLALRVLLGSLKKRAAGSNNGDAQSQFSSQSRSQQKSQSGSDELVPCAACSTYISQSSAVKVSRLGKEHISGWICQGYRDTGRVCQ